MIRTNLTPRSMAVAVLQRSKNGPRAIFRIDGELKDVPAEGANFVKIHRIYPNDLIGVYDRQCKPEWLEDDIKRYMSKEANHE